MHNLIFVLAFLIWQKNRVMMNIVVQVYIFDTSDGKFINSSVLDAAKNPTSKCLLH